MLLRPAAAAALLALALTGCSAAAGDASVPTDTLTDQVSALLEQQVGRAPEQVDCPDPLPAEVGAEVRCTLTDGGVSYGLTVTADEVDGTEVTMGVLVDEEPVGADGS